MLTFLRIAPRLTLSAFPAVRSVVEWEVNVKPRQAFGVTVRIIGLIVVLVAILYFISGFILLVDPNFRPNVSPAWHYFVDGVVAIVIGLYLLRGAPHIVRFAYPDEDSDTKHSA
jgi:hypothetical protein